MRLGQQNRRPCPYFFCSAILVTYVSKRRFEDTEMVEILPMHEIMNEALPPESCPASLMSLPLDAEMIRLLTTRERQDYNRLLDKARAENAQLPEMPFLRPPPPRSHSMLPKPGSRRFGRTPATEEDQPDWALGGRADEDVQANPQIHPLPPSQGGHPMTGRSGQMSVAGVRAHIVAANVEAQGAHGALTEMEDPNLNAALAALETAVNDYLNNAAGGLENAAGSIAAASEDGSEDLGGIYAYYQRLMEDELPAMRERLKEARDRILATKGQLEAVKGEILGLIEQAAEYSERL
jgi:hypothetical protein